jgi:NADH dehydrogenase/putative oxidoreductase
VFLRFWLAQSFLMSGLLKMADWDTAVRLATVEYPVSWLDPVTAAYLGVSIELVCPLLLIVGLATRMAAIPLLFLALVIQTEYRQLNEHLYWAMLFGWYVVMGAGPIALDRVLSRGLADTALPLLNRCQHLFAAITRHLGPIYQLLIRVGLALVIFAGVYLAATPTGASTWLSYQVNGPLLSSQSTGLAPLLGIVVPVLLTLGLGGRIVALLLTLWTFGICMGADARGLERIDYQYWMLFSALLLLRGAGPVSLDHAAVRWLRTVWPQTDWSSLQGLPHVVIIGAGFGGVTAARRLRNVPCQITLVDRRNYHLFQPLLYQVATATLSPSDVATPIRALFRDQPNVQVLFARVTDVDVPAEEVVMGDKRVRYDYLVLATGARHSYFGRDEWEPLAPGLKKIDDATDIRRRLLVAFEQAENAEDAEEQARWLTFIVVGGGPTGVELAGAIAELASHGMEREFRNIDPTHAKVILVQSGARLLPAFPEKLSEATELALTSLGVEVATNSRVEQIDQHGVVIGERRIEARTTFWAAGVAASPAAKWLKVESDRAGRVKVEEDLSVPGLPNVFAIGDTALATAWAGKPVPGLAPAAKQGGKYVADVIRSRVEGRRSPAPFAYRHQGSLATIGRKAAVADFGWVHLSGAAVWWLWGLIHIFFLVGGRNRASVVMEWFWSYLTFKRGTRLITGG